MRFSSSVTRQFLLFTAVCCLSYAVRSQETYKRSLHWKSGTTAKVKYSADNASVWFDDAISVDNTELPCFYEQFPLASGTTTVSAEMHDAIYQPFSSVDNTFIKSKISHSRSAELKAEIRYFRNRTYAGITINPLHYNATTGVYEKLISFTLNITPGFSILKQEKSWSFAAHSILASGNWHKMGITQSGIYKLTYSDLQTMGVSVGDPRNIRIYGNGGAFLPEYNYVFRYDDLMEIAIYVADVNGNNSFDPEDYVLFYGVGPAKWVYDSSAHHRFRHVLNKYSSTAFYFLTTDLGPGKRISSEVSLTQSPDFHVSSFDDYLFNELDSLNLIKSGREFYGKVFDIQTSYQWTYNVPNIVTGSKVRLNSNVIARVFQPGSSSFDIYLNGSKILNQHVAGVIDNFTATFANPQDTNDDTAYAITSSPLALNYVYNKPAQFTAIGWLDFFELNFTRYLSYAGSQMAFRNVASIGKGITEFTLGNAGGVSIWDVTDPLNVKIVTGTTSGNDFIFRHRTDSLKEYIAHSADSYFGVEMLGGVANQDLHGLGPTDMVIVTYPDFEGEADRLADFHRTHDGLKVVVVKPEWIYNEFSSGMQDPTAIKSFMKMFYDRAAGDSSLKPKYLLLFGDGSYDNMNRVPGNTDFVVTWQSRESLSPTNSYMTDDYYGYLRDSEGGGYGGNLAIGIGRLPAKSVEEAQALVDKILLYASTTDLNAQGSNCSGFNSAISNLADWRNVVCFVADDMDIPSDNFMSETEIIANKVDVIAPDYNIDKIYCDAYEQMSTPGGQRYPDVNDAITRRVEKGCLIMNYIGHGGETGWAHEMILTVSEINSWDNHYNMPLFVTATCEFSRLDDPARTSAGEYVLLNPRGGGIALFTTTRLAFSNSNFDLNSRFYNFVFSESGGSHPTLGEVVSDSKNSYGNQSSIANFCLLGDPALTLAYPKYNVVTTKINNHPVNIGIDTVRAMSKVTISGEIRDGSNNKLTDYNGILYPTVFDKRMTVMSLGNDVGAAQGFHMQKNIIYKGKASITNGDFNFSFLVPKDIIYSYDTGRISYYGQDGKSDANGYFEHFIIGGSETKPITDKEGPEIKLYLNDEHFVPGGITDKSPFLFARLADTSGLNTVGSGIGHDIAAVLDGNTDKTYVLNDYYESDLNTYRSGIVRYPFSDLSDGSHTLSLKAWDIFNNSSERSIDFVVAESANLALAHVLNYPNPFTTYTEFWFEHNRPCCGLEVQIQIFTISGKLVKTIDTQVETMGYRAEPIPWDGRDDYGDPIGKGVYIYKLRVKDNQGSYAEKTEKLVILK